MQHTRLRRVLTAQIEAAFGRPVEVGSYDFSLWDGPALEANSVTVGEDPRFGQEYFLRAESMTVRLRWASLLRGHVRLGTLSLNRPSLNLVRDAGGDWNLAEWLPQPSGSLPAKVPVGPSLPFSPLRFGRIEVDGGRINFKNGDDKLPLAFVGVTGAVETDAPGRWRMNLDATPWRAAVVVQQAGTIHLSGDLGGTSSRLRPAALDISWTDASISDVLRLAGRDDAGIRGALAMAVNARTRRSRCRLGHPGARGASSGPPLGSRAPAGQPVCKSYRSDELESLCVGHRVDRRDPGSSPLKRARLRMDSLERRGNARV